MGGGKIHEITCARNDVLYVVDANDNDRLDSSEAICFIEEGGGGGKRCYVDPADVEEVKGCLKGLGVDLAAPLFSGKSISAVGHLSSLVDFVRYGGFTTERAEEVASGVAEVARRVGVAFDGKIAARIAREGSMDLMEAEFILSESSVGSKSPTEIFDFEKHLLGAAKYAEEAGVALDKERAKKIMFEGYSNALEVARRVAEEIAASRPYGFDLSNYEVFLREVEEFFDAAKRAATGLGKPHDERWEKAVRKTAHESVYEGLAEMLIEASQSIDKVYNENDFFEEKGHRGLDFLKKTVTLAREAAKAGNFEFEEKFFEGIARDFSVAVYELEKRLVQAYSERPGIRIYLEVDFFPRARLWAYIAGIPYDEDWEQRMRERASDAY